MKDLLHLFQLVFAALGGFFGWFLGGFDGFLIALVVFMATDYISGVFRAVLQKNLSSEVGFRGIFKKVLILALVGIGNILDVYVFKVCCPVRNTIIFFYLSNEGISILENAGAIGLPIPKKLKTVLSQIKK